MGTPGARVWRFVSLSFLIILFVFFQPGHGVAEEGIPVRSDWLKIFSRSGRGVFPDAQAGFWHRPGKQVLEWPEHPQKRFEKRYNNYGFVSDSDTQEAKLPGSLRILVTGDSHIDGVVATRESFPNVLGTMLNAKDPTRSYDVLNGGCGFYTFTNYAGLLDKFIFLKPDIFVVVIYLGNDFLGVARALAKSGEIEMKRPRDYMPGLNGAGRRNPGAIGQYLNQALFFKTYPHVWERTREVAYAALDHIMYVARGEGIRVFFVFLPAKIMTTPPEATGINDLAGILGVTPDEMREFDRKAKGAVVDWMETRHAEYLDVADAMSRSSRELFWKKDHHLNVDGHQALAQWFFDKFGGEIMRFRRKID